MARTQRSIEPVGAHVDEVVDLCRRFGVQRLAVLGSAVDGEPDAASGIEFLVEFDPWNALSRFDAYFGLKEALESLLGTPVGLVDPSALQNPFLERWVADTRTELYAA